MNTPPGRVQADLAPSNQFGHEHFILIRLRALRRSLNLSAAMLDRHAGFAIGTTGRLERGDLRLYATHLYQIAEAVGMNVGYFYGQLGGPDTDHTNDDRELEKQSLLLAYMKIKDPALMRDVFELIEALAAQSQNTTC